MEEGEGGVVPPCRAGVLRLSKKGGGEVSGRVKIKWSGQMGGQRKEAEVERERDLGCKDGSVGVLR